MSALDETLISSIPELHVFEQDGAWHWGITVPRARGGGFKLVAFSNLSFSMRSAAYADGRQALARFADPATKDCGQTVGPDRD